MQQWLPAEEVSIDYIASLSHRRLMLGVRWHNNESMLLRGSSSWRIKVRVTLMPEFKLESTRQPRQPIVFLVLRSSGELRRYSFNEVLKFAGAHQSSIISRLRLGLVLKIIATSMFLLCFPQANAVAAVPLPHTISQQTGSKRFKFSTIIFSPGSHDRSLSKAVRGHDPSIRIRLMTLLNSIIPRA